MYSIYFFNARCGVLTPREFRVRVAQCRIECAEQTILLRGISASKRFTHSFCVFLFAQLYSKAVYSRKVNEFCAMAECALVNILVLCEFRHRTLISRWQDNFIYKCIIT